jgi:photosystem II biogenesis protein Psp29
VAGSARRVQSRTAGIVAEAAAGEHDVPTVADTKARFLAQYKKPIPSIYNNVLQELIVLHHFVRFNASYKYDPIFALGLVTVYDQLFDGYRNGEEEKDLIFRAYINALQEKPEQYREDAEALEEWAGNQTAESVLNFDGSSPAEQALQDISVRAKEGNFHYSRFFAIGLFRILNLAKASDPTTLEKLTKALNVSKTSVDRDLDVYRGLLTKLAAAKELLQEFLDREKKKAAERKTEADAKEVQSAPAAESS